MILHTLFSDHMVLQAEKPIRIFGSGAGHASVSFLGKTYEVDCRGGDWVIELPAKQAGGPYEMQVNIDGAERTITDVMIGEVIIAGGQSNMQLQVGACVPPTEFEIQDEPLVRYYNTQRPEPGEWLRPEWTVATKDKARGMSAVAYFAAIRLARAKGVAVGIVTAFQGAAILQSFIRPDLYAASECSKKFTPQYASYMLNYPVWSRPGMLYEFQIKRLSPLSVRAVVWYQGEANGHPEEAVMFTELMRMMMTSLREAFCDPFLPFVQVQLAPNQDRGIGTVKARQAQWRASQELTGLAIVTIGDVGEPHEIHPTRKEQVGQRVYRALMHTVYGHTEIPYLGPVKKTCTYEGGRVTVTFTHTEGGLKTDGDINCLYLIDEAGEKHLAKCRIEGDTLVGEADIAKAVGAEFGMEPFFEMHLFNGEGIPAVSFEDR